jgi:segregation and condensation protein B
MTLDSQLEGILFFKGEPVSIKELGKILSVGEDIIEEGLRSLVTTLEGRGLTLLRNEQSVMLGTSKELGVLLETLRKDELSKELTKSSLETLAIILYKKGTTRSEIDYIRGVNSSFILRNLLVRGLIEKRIDTEDSRRYVYMPTFQALEYMGITDIDMMPDAEKVRNILNNVIQEEDTTETNDATL